MDEKYLKAAKKEMKRIVKELGRSPKSDEFRSMAGKEFKLVKLTRHGLTLNKLKKFADVVVCKQMPDTRGTTKQIYCLSVANSISSNECVPHYKNICRQCKDIQMKNRKSIPDLTAEEQKTQTYMTSLGDKFDAGNSIYQTDNGFR